MVKYRNLRLMTSAWSPKYLPESLLHYMRTRGKDRIMFASDYPVLSMERCLGEAAALDLPDEVRQGWLYDNADAFFFAGREVRIDGRQAQDDAGPREKPQLIADELRALIVSGELSEGDSLGHEPDLVERFGVSRPSLREALRILEAEGLVTVVRGVRGGVVVHEPDERMTARTAALVLQARNVPLADVFEARSLLEPIAARTIASMRGRSAAIKKLRELIREEEAASRTRSSSVWRTPPSTSSSSPSAGNQTLTIVAEMLNEIVARAVTAVSQADDVVGSLSVRRRGIRSQERLLDLLEAGRRRGGRGALALPHAGRREGHARPAGLDRRRPDRPLLTHGTGCRLSPSPDAGDPAVRRRLARCEDHDRGRASWPLAAAAPRLEGLRRSRRVDASDDDRDRRRRQGRPGRRVGLGDRGGRHRPAQPCPRSARGTDHGAGVGSRLRCATPSSAARPSCSACSWRSGSATPSV